MDAPLKEIKRIEEILDQGPKLVDTGKGEAALELVEEGLGMDPKNLKLLALKASALEKLGRAEDAGQIRETIKALKKEAWKRQVEAEIRGSHDLMGEASRNEKF